MCIRQSAFIIAIGKYIIKLSAGCCQLNFCRQAVVGKLYRQLAKIVSALCIGTLLNLTITH